MYAHGKASSNVNVSSLSDSLVTAWVSVSSDELLDVDVSDVLVQVTLNVDDGSTRANFIVSRLGGVPTSAVMNVATGATVPQVIADVVGRGVRSVAEALLNALEACRSFVTAHNGI